MFSLLFNICEVIIGNTLFWSKNKRKFSSCGMSLFFDLIWSCKNIENTLKYCLRRSCFSGLFALRRIPSHVILNFSWIV